MENRLPKVIIFVKDRIVAEYLKKLLQKHKELRKIYPTDTTLLRQEYEVDMAMGPRGKNLVNKAFRSTKSNDKDEDNPEEA